jgi:hypothetical protein
MGTVVPNTRSSTGESPGLDPSTFGLFVPCYPAASLAHPTLTIARWVETRLRSCFDWTDASWHTSEEVYTVEPGDLITSSITFDKDERAYTMVIASGGKSISTKYALKDQQTKPETTAYFVVEHQPMLCKAYPTSGVTFQDIHVMVDDKLVAAPAWKAEQERPKCGSKAFVVGPQTIAFNWNTSATEGGVDSGDVPAAPPKWLAGITTPLRPTALS